MIKIVKVPLQLEPFLKEFEDPFTKPSYGSFRDLCGALSVCAKSKTVANLCDTMAECRKGKKARSSYNWFFSDANWNEDEVAQRGRGCELLKERQRIDSWQQITAEFNKVPIAIGFQ
jgi:hypothetical protein